MSTLESIYAETKDRMQKTVDSFKKDLSRIRTGRASPSLLEGISVEYYGTPMPVNQVATITIPEARLILIQPWEKSMLSPIEKAIRLNRVLLLINRRLVFQGKQSVIPSAEKKRSGTLVQLQLYTIEQVRMVFSPSL